MPTKPGLLRDNRQPRLECLDKDYQRVIPTWRQVESERNSRNASGGRFSIQRTNRAELHEEPFTRLGVRTCVVVLDNVREGRLAPVTYDSSVK
jgi:hypothetical protein